MRPPPRTRAEGARVAVAPLLIMALGGCHFIGDLAGAAAGGAAAAGSANPAVGIAVGVAVNSGIDALTSHVVRMRQRAEQDAIATEVASLNVGDVRQWKIEHTVPIGNEHGQVRVTRVIATPLTLCKELVFSVESGGGETLNRRWYSTQVCQNGPKWKWSLAEPAVERWGSIQ
jgi:hypothetical protein